MGISKYKVVFMGTPKFAVPSLQVLIDNQNFEVNLIITQPDKPIGRNKILKPSPIKELALINNIEVITPNKIKGNVEVKEKIKQAKPDVIVVAAYGKILPQEILNIPKMGTVNIHASLLPKYRGASPIVSSILAGDKETGVTLIKLDAQMDTGPIIATSQLVLINQNDTTVTLSDKLSEIGANLLINNLAKYIEGQIKPQPQDNAGATYVKLIKKSDGKINWDEPAEIIARKIRAYAPWPSIFTKYQDKLLKIISAEIIDKTTDKISGTIWMTDDKYPAVNTSLGSLKLIKVQLAGKKSISGRNFLLGQSGFINSKLG